MISKKDITHLAALSRIEIPEAEKETLLKDLERILEYFEELKNAKTDSVAPFSFGKEEQNITRSDSNNATRLDGERAVEIFPEQRGRFLKIPPVFE